MSSERSLPTSPPNTTRRRFGGFLPLAASLSLHAFAAALCVRAGLFRTLPAIRLQGGGGRGDLLEITGSGEPPTRTEPAPALPAFAGPAQPAANPLRMEEGGVMDATLWFAAKSPAAMMDFPPERDLIGLTLDGAAEVTGRFPHHAPSGWPRSADPTPGAAHSEAEGGSTQTPAPSQGTPASEATRSPRGESTSSSRRGGAAGLSGLPKGLSGNRPPQYPADARRGKQEGMVQLSVEVGEDGSVGALSVDESSGHPLLDQAALEAVRQWRFTPERVDGIAVRTRGRIPIQFVLRESVN